MGKILLISTLIISIAACEARAQLEYKPGYIVTNTGDTVHGKIKTRLGSKAATTCSFRDGSSTIQYGPDQIEVFAFTGNGHYVSGVEPGCFVEELIRGELSLYKSGQVFFVRKNDDKPVRLETGRIMDTTDVNVGLGTDVVYGYREDNRWKGKLTVLTSDNTGSIAALHDLTFDEKSLRRFVREYNLGLGAKYKEY
jgi:hypothetical protein